MVQLTRGAIASIMQQKDCGKPILQVLSYKAVPGSERQERFRLQVSDGQFYHTFAMLATQLNDLIHRGEIQNFAVIQVDRYICNVIKAATENKQIIILLDVTVLNPGSEVGTKIGNPVMYSAESAAKSMSSAPVRDSPAPVTPAPPKATVTSYGNSGGLGASALGGIPSIPIASISPYQNKWTIQARVTSKTPIKHWSNARGEGKLFSMDLLDQSGEIRFTAFNQQVDKFFNEIEINKVYYVSRCMVKSANKKFTSINHDYELSAVNETQINPCYEDNGGIPEVTFNFVDIGELEKVEPNVVIDVIGVCKSCEDVQTVTSRTTNKEFKKREIELINSNNISVRFTIWGEEAEQFEGGGNPVIAVKGAKVSDYSGRSLSAVSSTAIRLNPDLKEAHMLRGWFDHQGRHQASKSLTQRALGSSDASMSFAEAKLSQLGSDKADYYANAATVVLVKKENAMYQACPSDGCNKKVIDVGNGAYQCEKCSKEYPNFSWRLLLQMNLADATDNCWVTCFQESAEAILGCTAQDLGDYKEAADDRYQECFEKIQFHTFQFKLRVKSETYNDETRLKTTIVAASPLNFREHNRKLISEIRELVAQG